MCQSLPDGMQLLAYPTPDGALVALGFERAAAHRVRAETVLRKRAEQLPRFGAWLPAMLHDGSWYVVRRVPDGAALAVEQLQVARELLI